MARLVIYHEDGSSSGRVLTGMTQITNLLSELGVHYERWPVDDTLAANADQETVLQVYDESVKKLSSRYNIQSIDVVALGPDNPQKAEFRQKFLAEHTHADFEIRFFVDGRGLFYLHIDNKVYLLLCEKGDLISVPANTTHWFDMGANPDFKCIRLFTAENGWVGDFTGSEIAKRFPDMDEFVGEYL